MTQLLKRTGFGFILGMAVGNLIAALTGSPDIVSPELLARAGSLSRALLYQTLCSGLIGAAGMAGMSLYDWELIEHWSLLLTTVVHYELYLAVFLPVGRFLGWFTAPVEMLVMAVLMGAAHTLIFLLLRAYYRRQVKELNELQKRYHGKKETNGGR